MLTDNLSIFWSTVKDKIPQKTTMLHFQSWIINKIDISDHQVVFLYSCTIFGFKYFIVSVLEPGADNTNHGFCLSGYSADGFHNQTTNMPFYFVGAPGAQGYNGNYMFIIFPFFDKSWWCNR